MSFLQAILANPDNLGADGADDFAADLVVIYEAADNVSHLVMWVYYGFTVGPAEGTYLKIYDGDGSDEAQIVFQLPITADGPGIPIRFDPALEGTAGNDLVVVLMNAASGDDSPGALNVGHVTRG